MNETVKTIDDENQVANVRLIMVNGRLVNERAAIRNETIDDGNQAVNEGGCYGE